MIGRKVFSKANNNSNANPLGDAIISSGPATPPPAPHPSASLDAPASGDFAPQPAKAKASGAPKTALVVVISVLATAAVAAIAYFIFLAPHEETGEVIAITYASPDNDGTKTVEETLTEFDNKIEDAKSEDESLGFTLNKAGYYNLMEDYDSAIALLDGINITSLSDFDQYRVYNYYASAYAGKGDQAKADRYRTLADEANARDMGGYGE